MDYFIVFATDVLCLVLFTTLQFVSDLMVCGTLNANVALEDLVLYSAAPLVTAVRLSQALSLASLKDKVRFLDLRAAARHCEIMASDLLKLASTSEGLDTGMVLRAVDHQGASMLDCLIEGKQKHVVSMLAVQKYLTEVWYGGRHWKSWEILLLFLCLLAFPFLWLALSLPHRHRYASVILSKAPSIFFSTFVGQGCLCKKSLHNLIRNLFSLRFNTIPIVKFTSHLASHIFLLTLLILTVIYLPTCPLSDRWLIPRWHEWVLLTWLCGILVSEVSQSTKRTGLVWIRVLLLVVSAAAVLSFALQSPPIPRNIFFVIAMTLGFVQLFEFLMFHHLFGPWAIIIKKMMSDLCRFAIILLLFYTIFLLSLSAINNLIPSTDSQSCRDNVSEPQMSHRNSSVLLFF